MDGIKNEDVLRKSIFRCASRNQLESFLAERGIKTVKHYPIPIPFQKAYGECNAMAGDFPVTEEISNTILSIPLFGGMTEEEIEYVIETINSFSK